MSWLGCGVPGDELVGVWSQGLSWGHPLVGWSSDPTHTAHGCMDVHPLRLILLCLACILWLQATNVVTKAVIGGQQ